MNQDEALRGYARDPRNYRRHLQEADDVEAEVAAQPEPEKPVTKKSKK